MGACQQAQADAAGALATVQLVEAADVAAEAPSTRGEQRGQPEAQQQVERAVGGALVQEAQAAGEPAAQRVLAQQEQQQPVLGVLWALCREGGAGGSSRAVTWRGRGEAPGEGA